MFLYSLLALAVVTALIFAAPLKAKVWATLAVVAAGALWASATAVGVLAGGHTVRLWATDVFLFGSDAGSMDPLSALFALIVSVGAVAAVLYSRGYLAHYLGRKSPGPHLAALHRAGDDVLRHAGRSDLRRRIFIPLFLGADDRRIVPADPVRRRAPRSAPRRAGLRDHDARGIRPAAHRLRAVGQRLRIGRLRPVGRIFPHAARPAAVRGLPRGLRHESRHVPDARLAARSASRRLRRMSRP